MRLGDLTICFNNSGGCEDVVHSQVVTFYQLLWDVQNLKAQISKLAPKQQVSDQVFDQQKCYNNFKTLSDNNLLEKYIQVGSSYI